MTQSQGLVELSRLLLCAERVLAEIALNREDDASIGILIAQTKQRVHVVTQRVTYSSRLARNGEAPPEKEKETTDHARGVTVQGR